MFTKALILLLLGTSLVLANPVNPNSIEIDQSFKNKVNGWLHTVGNKFKEYYQQGNKSFGEVKPPNSYVTELSKEKYAELKYMYNDLKKDAKIALADKIVEYAIANEKAKLGAKFNNWKEMAKKYINLS